VWELLTRLLSEGREGELVVIELSGTRHRVLLRGGYVVAVHVAGRFDPLLEILRQCGAMRPEAWYRTLEELARSDRPSGELALRIGGVSAVAVQAALRAQQDRRLRILAERVREGATLRFEPRRVRARDVVARIGPWDLPAEARRSRGERPPAISEPPAARFSFPTDRREARRQLRKLARLLHPDRNAHLDAKTRAELAARLAEATAAYHRLLKTG
jgi:hypothetical protein